MLIQIGSKKSSAVLRDYSRVKPVTYANSALVYVEHKCHLACKHCYESEETHPTGNRLSVDDYKKIFAELKKLGVMYLAISGGEIFLRRDVLDIVAEARRQRFWVKLLTSGTHINEAKAKRIKELKVGRVEVSLYSSKAADHDDFTQRPGSHGRTQNAVKILQKYGIPTVVKTNIMPFNIDDLEDMKKWANAHGAHFQMSPTVHSRVNGDQEPNNLTVAPEIIAEKVHGNSFLYPTAKPLAHYENTCTGEGNYYGDLDKRVCGAGAATLVVDARGEVFPCTAYPISAGNMLEEPLMKIWNESYIMNKVRGVTYRDFSENGCNTCENQKTCHPCQGMAEVENQDHLGCSVTSKHMAQIHQAHWDRMKTSPVN